MPVILGEDMSTPRAAVACLLLTTACGSSAPPSTAPSTVNSSPPPPTAPVVTSVQVGVLGNAPPVFEPAQSKQLWALGAYADGGTVDVTNVAVWRTSNPVVATVSAGGVVTSGGFGHADITATVSSVTGILGIDVGGAFELPIPCHTSPSRLQRVRRLCACFGRCLRVRLPVDRQERCLLVSVFV
jgi:hypothetical protein